MKDIELFGINEKKTSIRNSTMDIFKALACIGVVLMHIRFPGKTGIAVRALGCFGVPLFFCISGYWLSSKELLDVVQIQRKLKHIVSLIIEAEIVHTVISLILFDLLNPVKREAFIEKYFVHGWIEKWLITNAPPVYAHLWFLYALATLYLLILLFISSKRQLRMLSITIPFLILGIILLQEFGHLKAFGLKAVIPIYGATTKIYWAHTLLLRALPFFLLGFTFRECSSKIEKCPCRLAVLILLIIACETAAVIECFCFCNSQFYVGNIMATILIMFTCCKWPTLQCKPLEYLGGSLSTWVYICHVLVYKVLGYITGKLHISGNVLVQWLMPIAGLVCSISIAMFIDVGSKSIRKFCISKGRKCY